MTSIQQLQKLYHIQSLCQAEQSLESAVASERVAQAIQRTEQLIRQRAFLREERRRLRIATESTEERAELLKGVQRPDWLPEQLRSMLLSSAPTAPQGLHPASKNESESLPSLIASTTPSSSSGPMKTNCAEETVHINIGGLMFETPVSVLMRDKHSLLAQLCPGTSSSSSPLILADPDGFYYFDRDWWLFRHILQFLRDGSLPDDRPLLAQLYREAAFFKLQELQTAIEEEKLHLRSPAVGKDGDKGKGSSHSNAKWWRTAPNWNLEMAEVKRVEDSKKKKADWWTDSNYKGKTYLPLSTAADKVVTSVGERDEQRTLAGTWTSCSSSNSPGRSREAPSSYRSDYQSQHTSDIYDITSSSSSGRPILSHSYPYPHPSPYSHLKSNTAAFSQPQSQSYSQPRFEGGGGGGDGRGNDNGSGSLQTYRSPFRDSSALKDRNESP